MSDRPFNVLFLCTGNIEKERAFTAFKYLKSRVSAFISLTLRSLDKMALGAKLWEIGRLDGATP
jgi:arsenate reductase (thioredoxin)